jgi:hypothetical protein
MLLKCKFCFSCNFVFCWNAVYKLAAGKLNELQRMFLGILCMLGNYFSVFISPQNY